MTFVPSKREHRLDSRGWTGKGKALRERARAEGVCAQCGRKLRSKYPVGDERRYLFCWGGVYPNRCSDLFYEAHYQAWGITKRAVLRRVRARFAGQIRCERCQREPKEIRQDHDLKGFGTYSSHRVGYEFDHIAEIAAGGDPFDIDNIQLLCLACHKRKTAAFLRRKTPSALPPFLLPLETFQE